MSSTGLAGREEVLARATAVSMLLVWPMWLLLVLTALTSLLLLTAGPMQRLPSHGEVGEVVRILPKPMGEARNSLASPEIPQNKLGVGDRCDIISWHHAIHTGVYSYHENLQGCPLSHSLFRYVCDASIQNQNRQGQRGRQGPQAAGSILQVVSVS